MKNLYIVGARGFGREIFYLAKESIGFQTEYKIAGFLDDNASALDDYKGYPSVISSVEAYEPKENDVFIVALGDVKYKKKYIDILNSKGANFYSLIHKDAYISPNTTIGKGCIVCAYVRISCDVEVGDYNTFQPFSVVGHDVKIGNGCHFNTYSFMGGFVVVEDEVTLHTGAIIHPHKVVRRNSTVGAGAVVIRNVQENSTVYGNPAKKLIL
ncbi:MAG: acetyltransferase [Muribaculaceae bacterium]|nr:acetyltransferase [Muribaculaceae bacterium]